MSGGHYDSSYLSFKISQHCEQMNEELVNTIISDDRSEVTDEERYTLQEDGSELYHDVMSLKQFLLLLSIYYKLYEAAMLEHRADWVMSGDDDDNSFIDSTKEDFEKYTVFIKNNVILPYKYTEEHKKAIMEFYNQKIDTLKKLISNDKEKIYLYL